MKKNILGLCKKLFSISLKVETEKSRNLVSRLFNCFVLDHKIYICFLILYAGYIQDIIKLSCILLFYDQPPLIGVNIQIVDIYISLVNGN